MAQWGLRNHFLVDKSLLNVMMYHHGEIWGHFRSESAWNDG